MRASLRAPAAERRAVELDEVEWEQARCATRGVESVVHLNNAGAALPPDCVVEAMIDHLRLEAEIGGYEAAEQAAGVVAGAYDSLASLLGCASDEIAFTDSASRAWSLGFSSFAFGENDRILASPFEYGSNWISLLHSIRRTTATVELIPLTETGEVSVDALASMIDDRVKLIVMTHVPSNGGLVNPIAAVGDVAREAGVPYLVDACQSVGQIPISVDEVGCGLLAGCGRKYLRGPRGTGFLYVRRELLDRLEPAQIGLDGASWVTDRSYEYAADARRFETWETNVAASVGLAVALRYALDLGVERVWPRIRDLAERLREGLAATPGVRVVDMGTQHCGLVSFTVDGTDSRRVYADLASRRINTWVAYSSTACVDMERRGLRNLLRASVHYYNSEEEVDTLCDAVGSIARSSAA
jgi:selenocysteine lyase/cysteine desulfurase